VSEVVLDASALLAYLFDEPGADVASEALLAGPVISTVNLSEVLTLDRSSIACFLHLTK